jgi:hypothetical protein
MNELKITPRAPVTANSVGDSETLPGMPRLIDLVEAGDGEILG